MTNNFIILFILLITNSFTAQAKIIQDIEADGIKDTISIDAENLKLVAHLSTKKFKKIYSGEIESLDGQGRIRATKNGFELDIDWMGAGYAYQFRYNKFEKKIQLIGMSRYEFGPANNDGSGESSVNLLTGNYIGNWNYYDLRREKLIKIPTIKAKMIFPKTFFENFEEKIVSDYSEKCANLFLNNKANRIGR
ncbi:MULTISPECIES: hypothetical protein [unclassified Chryseobacterium]|uniref:hypothetical protein n=1 Tax=unclassified Chryseobacterium TaxID=2593645 RepID=UPI002269B51C|nr:MULTISPECIES: hypothetical protein [unclassified Chryseobacterium]